MKKKLDRRHAFFSSIHWGKNQKASLQARAFSQRGCAHKCRSARDKKGADRHPGLDASVSPGRKKYDDRRRRFPHTASIRAAPEHLQIGRTHSRLQSKCMYPSRRLRAAQKRSRETLAGERECSPRNTAPAESG